MSTEVKKLDDPAIFDAIPTGYKTTAGLKPYELAKYNSLFNQFKSLGIGLTQADKGQLAWLTNNCLAIIKYVERTYVPPKYAPSTLRGYLEAIANICLSYDKFKFRPLVRSLFNRGLSMQRIIDERSEDSEMAEQEKNNFVPYEDLVKMRDLIYAKWSAHPRNIKWHMFYLILAINTMIPPLRLNWVGMEIYPPRLVEGAPRKVVAKGPPPENQTNYLWEITPGHWALVLNQDKIENRRKKAGKERQIMKLDDEIPGVTNGKDLNDVINKSLGILPRNYVLLGIKTKAPMGVSGYDSALGELFKPQKPRQNLIRKSYVNHWYKKDLSIGVLKEIADRMRHSIGVAMGSYRKVGLESKHEEAEVKSPPPSKSTLVASPRPKPAALPIAPQKPYFKPAEYSREYRAANRETIMRKKAAYYEAKKHKILRAKILANLNNGVVKEPKKSSIEKYQLRQHVDTGLWYYLGGED